MALTIGSCAAAAREPRQIRKEAAVSGRRRVPQARLVRAIPRMRARGVAIDGGCTAFDNSRASRTFYPPVVPERGALYRRYRPQTFSAIVGQEHVTRTLRNAIASGQVSHAYLLSGSRGIGKTTIARLIAKAVNCTKAKDGEPCDACENCLAIRDGRFLDLIEIDAASNRGIDEMRDLREKVRFAPSQGNHKVYVIDEAHQLTSEAFNALLKTLEEPPPHVIFVLATTEAGKIPGTIVSRTQRFDLRRIPFKGVVAQLAAICEQEKLATEPAALDAIARHAQGSLRDAESILDMVATFSEGKVTLADVDELLGVSEWEETSQLFDALAANDGAAGVRLIGKLVDEGRDLRLFVRPRARSHARARARLVDRQGTGDHERARRREAEGAGAEVQPRTACAHREALPRDGTAAAHERGDAVAARAGDPRPRHDVRARGLDRSGERWTGGRDARTADRAFDHVTACHDTRARSYRNIDVGARRGSRAGAATAADADPNGTAERVGRGGVVRAHGAECRRGSRRAACSEREGHVRGGAEGLGRARPSGDDAEPRQGRAPE